MVSRNNKNNTYFWVWLVFMGGGEGLLEEKKTWINRIGSNQSQLFPFRKKRRFRSQITLWTNFQIKKFLPLCTEGELSALTGPGGGQYTFLAMGTQCSDPSWLLLWVSSSKHLPSENMKKIGDKLNWVIIHVVKWVVLIPHGIYPRWNSAQL